MDVSPIIEYTMKIDDNKSKIYIICYTSLSKVSLDDLNKYLKDKSSTIIYVYKIPAALCDIRIYYIKK